MMESPKATQSLYLADRRRHAFETGKPHAQAQFMIEQAWPKNAGAEAKCAQHFRERDDSHAGGQRAG